MDNSEKSVQPIGSSVGSGAGLPMESGSRVSIHAARTTGSRPRPPSSMLPMVDINKPIQPPPAARRNGVPIVGASSAGIAAVPAAVQSPIVPNISPQPPESLDIPPMEEEEEDDMLDGNTQTYIPDESEMPAYLRDDDETCALMPESIEENATKALMPDNPVGGLPFTAEELSAEPEIDAEAQVVTLPVGMKIDDRYEILGVLGVGGFATVYRAHHLTIDRDVALKVMDLKKGVDPSYSQRFFREAKIAAKIHHNNVVSIYDFGHVGETGQPYIAMEMLHGHDLSHELTEAGPLSPKRAFVLFRPVLDALAQGHRLGIVHKDLKPENLYLVDPRGQHELMKVLDFGVARINSSEVAKLTSAGQLLGTPRYLAPEYIKQQLVSPAIDVYQMALIISEALTGIPAVSGDPFHAMMLHCSGQLQIAGFLLEDRVGEVFKKAISIDPEQRYADCEAFGNALDSIADCFQSEVPLKGGAPQLTPDSSTSSKMTAMPFNNKINTGENGFSGQIDYPVAKKSSKPIVILAIFVVLIAASAVVYFAYSKQVPPPPAEPEVIIKTEAPPDPSFEFELSTTPEGAGVFRNGIHPICTKTPCKVEFKSSELRNTQYIVFKLEGYNDKPFEFKETTYDETNGGKVMIELEKAEAEITELEFTLEYTPTNANVVEADTGKTVCSSSPCKYSFKLERGYVPLRFQAAGYRSQTENIAKPLYDRTGGNVKVELVKETQRKPSPGPGPGPGPVQPPPPSDPKPWSNGHKCSQNTDCKSNFCHNGSCKAKIL
ncbi:MAG: serine/threonine protein kinase [Proteobacteria bacterium]|nr:serine/threonine protein kinase [Pseudomonadota bacterium]